MLTYNTKKCILPVTNAKKQLFSALATPCGSVFVMTIADYSNSTKPVGSQISIKSNSTISWKK